MHDTYPKTDDRKMVEQQRRGRNLKDRESGRHLHGELRDNIQRMQAVRTISSDAKRQASQNPDIKPVAGFDRQPASYQAHYHGPLQTEMQGDNQQCSIGCDSVGLTRGEAGANRQKAEHCFEMITLVIKQRQYRDEKATSYGGNWVMTV